MMLKREEVIIETVNHLLSTKGFDAMTVDEVADTVGIAKASLYRHFPGKESLAIAALLDTMQQCLAELDNLQQQTLPAIDKLKAVIQWAMLLKLNKKMPNLPSENSALVAHLKQTQAYINNLIEISDTLGEWIEQAKQDNQLNTDMPSIVILYTLYARSCDPVLTFLQQSDLFDDKTIINMVTKTCFEGLS